MNFFSKLIHHSDSSHARRAPGDGHLGAVSRLQPAEACAEVGSRLEGLTQTEAARRQKKFGLTLRELEIVSAVVAGYSNKEIAEYFKISEDTVKHHLSNIFDKLGVSTRLELARFAVDQGLPLKPIG